jgi:transcriptional regulator with XRE-family HTH domain
MNEGQQALRRIVQRTPEREIARRCRVTQQAVSLWINGQRRPDFFGRVHAEIQFGISLHAWDRDVAVVGDAVGCETAERRTG